jgi:phenylpropionate dioxygenase-like ring-hydroxylating dioxygenase large terminal subunit
VVVYRDDAGKVHALENRCLHRAVPLDRGQVQGCKLVCPYHGWVHSESGQLASIPYGGKSRLPKATLRVYPLQEQGGFIWIFPGDPVLATNRHPPETSDMTDQDWMEFPLDNDFANHYAIGVINGMDYFHFHIHRDYQPWRTIEVESVQSEPEAVRGVYKITSRAALPDRIFKWLLGGSSDGMERVRRIKVHFLYPHHLAEVDDDLKVWVFFLPLGADRVRVFITMYIRRRGLSRHWHYAVQRLLSPLVLRKIQAQDALAGALEQEGWQRYPHIGRYEINPISVAVQRMITEKWAAFSAQAIKLDDGSLARPRSIGTNAGFARSTPVSIGGVEPNTK